MKVYQFLAQCGAADNICCMDMASKFVMDLGPSGDGFDCGIELIAAGRDSLELKSAYHCLDENGNYNGWINYTVKVKASLLWEFDMTITGETDGEAELDDATADYITDTLHDFLNDDISKYTPLHPNFINATWK